MSPRKVLVVSAHPGDEVLGCGGTLARHTAAGDDVTVLTLGDGMTSRIGDFTKAQNAIDLSAVEKQSRDALGLLGVKMAHFSWLPDNRFDSLPLLDIIKHVESIKAAVKPDVVYTNSPFDLSVDERRTFEAVTTAFRPVPGDNACALYCFELLSSTEWNIPGRGANFSPNTYMDITRVLPNKIEAYKRFTTEARPWPHPRSSQAIEHRARVRGAACGFEAAEAFQLIRAIILNHGP